MKRIIGLSNFIYLCLFHPCFSQAIWEKVPQKVQNKVTVGEYDTSKPYKDENYNYGSASNPSPRTDAVSWADPKGYLWIFGGVGLDENYQWGVFRDMWKYDPLSNNWELINGERNKSNMTNTDHKREQPLARKEAASWVDKNGDLWMFGGRDLNDFMHLDDMWKFETGNMNWRKISGEEKFNVKPKHGTMSKEQTGNYPGSRSLASTWTDMDGQTLWLFGGVSYASEQKGKASYYNDLWRFNTKSGEWTWVSGNDKPNKGSVISKDRDQGHSLSPGGRSSSVCWYHEKTNSLLLYGGYGYDSTATHLGALSDFWTYSIKTNTWINNGYSSKINLETEVFTMSKPSEKNTPGFRISANGWTFGQDELFMFSGHTTMDSGMIDTDLRLWKYSLSENQWSVVPVKDKPDTLGSGRSFTDQKGTVYFFGGLELDRNLFQSRPTNAVWKLAF